MGQLGHIRRIINFSWGFKICKSKTSTNLQGKGSCFVTHITIYHVTLNGQYTFLIHRILIIIVRKLCANSAKKIEGAIFCWTRNKLWCMNRTLIILTIFKFITAMLYVIGERDKFQKKSDFSKTFCLVAFSLDTWL